MQSGVKIPGHKNLSNQKRIGYYKEVKYVYIPLINQNDTNITVMVKKGDYVKKGTVIGKRKGELRVPILSSVSGTVIDFVEKYCFNGSLIKCVKIENDFQEVEELLPIKKQMNEYTKEEFIERLRDAGIIGLGGSGFPTYVKYETEAPLKTLLVNAVECEPYITSDYMIMKEHMEDILEAIDSIIDIMGLEEAIIAVKKNHSELIRIINNFIGTYLRIKVVPVSEKYGIGWERVLIQEVKHVTYQSLPSEKGIVVNNVSTIYAIYEALKYGKPLTERVVTFTGEMIKQPQNILVPVGVPAVDVIQSIGGYKRSKEIRFVAGGPMMGITLPTDDLALSPNINCILVLKGSGEGKELECMRCGKCIQVCPAKLSPVLIKDYKKNKRRLKELKPEKCVSCGLCSYICPAHIDLRTIVNEAKKER